MTDPDTHPTTLDLPPEAKLRFVGLERTHIDSVSGTPVVRITVPHRHNGQTLVVMDPSGRTERVGTDRIWTLKEYLA